MEPKESNEKTSKRKLMIWITIVFAVALLLIALSLYLILVYPKNQVSQLGITNVTEKTNFINQTRTTLISFITLLAQIFGGVAVGIGIYFAWENLKVAQEGQITERFTRAVNQLGAIDQSGNPAIEIRLGGIYALERIAKESEKDYWPIIEILTAYVRKNSPNIGTENEDIHGILKQNKISLDIQAILTVIGRRKYSYFCGEPTFLDLHETCLKEAIFRRPNLKVALLLQANLKRAFLVEADLEKATLALANLEGANLEGADLKEADLEGAILCGARLKGAKNLTIDQLSKVKTLYNAELDKELEIQLRKNDLVLFEKPNE